MHKTHRLHAVLWALALGLLFAADAVAQRMPQDNWYLYDTWTLGSGSAVGMTMDTNGYLYVAGDRSDRIHVLDGDGNTVALLGDDSGEGHLDSPRDVDLGPDGLLYVIEYDDRQVSVYTTGGAYVRSWGSSGTGDGQFGYNIYGIAVSAEGEVFVADTANHRIQVFDLAGNFLRKWGSYGPAPTEFDDPRDVAVGPDGKVYVADRGNKAIKKFALDGTLLDEISVDSPYSVSLTPDGLVLAGPNISVFDSGGAFLKSFPSGGYPRPRHVGQDGTVYASFSRSIQVWKRTYRTTGATVLNAPPMPYVSRAEQRAGTPWMDIDFTVRDADSSNVTVAVVAFVDGGNDFTSLLPVRTLVDNTETNLGSIPANEKRSLTWDVAADWDTQFGQVEVEMLARDERANLLDIQYITIPSNDVDPELTLSRSPLTEPDFYNAWLWLIATGDPAIVLMNGVVRGTNGVYLTDSVGRRGLLNPEGEPNDTVGAAPLLSFTNDVASVEGAMLNSEAYDWYAFDVAESNTLCQLSVADSPAGSGLRFESIYCYNAGLGTVWDWPGDGPSYSHTFTLTAPGRYYIRLQRDSGNVEPGTYRLALGVGEALDGTTLAGRQFLFERLGVREATQAEVDRALEGNVPGTVNQWAPRIAVGPDERPKTVNEYGFDTGDWGAGSWWVVPLP